VILASVHKCLRIGDLCKELAVGTQRAGWYSRNLRNSMEANVLYRQFLENLASSCSEKTAWNDPEEGQGHWNTSKAKNLSQIGQGRSCFAMLFRLRCVALRNSRRVHS